MGDETGMFQPKGQNSQVLVEATSEDRKRTALWRDPIQ